MLVESIIDPVFRRWLATDPLDAGSFGVKAASFIIGANTLDTTEWAYLDDLDQSLATTDSPTFAGLTVDTDTLYVDSANNRVGMGELSPEGRLHLYGTDQASTSLYFERESNDAWGPYLLFRKARGDDVAASDGDECGGLRFEFLNDGTPKTWELAAKLVGFAFDVSDGSERGGLLIPIMNRAGASTYAMISEAGIMIGGGASQEAGQNVAGGTADFEGRSIHVYSQYNRAHFVVEGYYGGRLDLIDHQGAADDKILELEMDGGIGVWRSLNDDLTNRTDNILVMDLGTGNITMAGTLEVGSTIQTYTPTNVTTDRSYDADTVAVAELADVVGTLIADLQTIGLID